MVVERQNAALDDPEPELAYYHCSRCLDQYPNAQTFATLVRGHWAGCEIRNHWVRDALFKEDKTTIRDRNINANLATLRCCLIAMKARLPQDLSWPQIIESAQQNQAFAYQLIANHRLK